MSIRRLARKYLVVQQRLTRFIANLKRTLIVLGVNIFLQLTGQNFVSVYGAIFIKSIGVINPFTMTSINTAVSIVFVLLCQFATDRTGRVYVIEHLLRYRHLLTQYR